MPASWVDPGIRTMKRFLLALAAAGATIGAAEASADGIMDAFRFEFGVATPESHDTDKFRHRTDFLHYRDYYINPGYSDPYRYTTCRETRVRGEDGRIIRRITCYGRDPAAVPPR